MASEYLDPLGRVIWVSDNTEGAGDHPFKHNLSEASIGKTLSSPNWIYAHSHFQNTEHYVRLASAGHPDFAKGHGKDTMCLVVVRTYSGAEGSAITSHFTGVLSESVDVNKVIYDAKKDKK